MSPISTIVIGVADPDHFKSDPEPACTYMDVSPSSSLTQPFIQLCKYFILPISFYVNIVFHFV